MKRERGMKAGKYKVARSRRPEFVSPPITAQPSERAPHWSQKFIIDERKRGPTVAESVFVSFEERENWREKRK